MFTTPYATTPCQGYNVAGIRAELARALIEHDLSVVRTSAETSVEGVFEVPPYVKSIPPYTHPMIMDARSWNSGCPDVVVDTRAFTKSSGPGNQLQAASGQQADWDFFKLYARFAHRWVCGYANDFKHLGHVAPTVFIRWLSGVVVSRLNLSPFEHVGVSAVTGYYFYCLFLNREDVDASEKLKISQQVSRVTQIPATKVLEYIDRVTDAPMDINGYVRALQEAVDTTRFDKFSPALIYQMIVGHWWGAHAREIIAVALEYPPAFYAILFTAFTNKGVKRSVFADQALKIKRGDEDTQFALAVARFIEV